MTQEKFEQLLTRRLRDILLDQLCLSSASEATVAEKGLASFFEFATGCVRKGLLQNPDILTLFEDLYECCQEQHLSKLFPLFERAILGTKADGSDRI